VWGRERERERRLRKTEEREKSSQTILFGPLGNNFSGMRK
jgi:hypothetical protein